MKSSMKLFKKLFEKIGIVDHKIHMQESSSVSNRINREVRDEVRRAFSIWKDGIQSQSASTDGIFKHIEITNPIEVKSVDVHGEGTILAIVNINGVYVHKEMDGLSVEDTAERIITSLCKMFSDAVEAELSSKYVFSSHTPSVQRLPTDKPSVFNFNVIFKFNYATDHSVTTKYDDDVSTVELKNEFIDKVENNLDEIIQESYAAIAIMTGLSNNEAISAVTSVFRTVKTPNPSNPFNAYLRLIIDNISILRKSAVEVSNTYFGRRHLQEFSVNNQASAKKFYFLSTISDFIVIPKPEDICLAVSDGGETDLLPPDMKQRFVEVYRNVYKKILDGEHGVCTIKGRVIADSTYIRHKFLSDNKNALTNFRKTLVSKGVQAFGVSVGGGEVSLPDKSEYKACGAVSGKSSDGVVDESILFSDGSSDIPYIVRNIKKIINGAEYRESDDSVVIDDGCSVITVRRSLPASDKDGYSIEVISDDLGRYITRDSTPDDVVDFVSLILVGNRCSGIYDGRSELSESLLYMSEKDFMFDHDKYTPTLNSAKEFWKEIVKNKKKDLFFNFVFDRIDRPNSEDVDVILAYREPEVRAYLNLPYKIDVGIEVDKK